MHMSFENTVGEKGDIAGNVNSDSFKVNEFADDNFEFDENYGKFS